MKNLIIKNKLLITGAALGTIAGFLYWKYVGCLTGTCAITLNPVESTVYFAAMGAWIFSLFKKPKNQLYND